MKGLAALSLFVLASALPQDIGEGSPKPIGKTMAKTISTLRGKDGKLHGAFELHCPEGNFWSMSFPAAGARPMKRVFVAKSVVR